MGVKSRNIKHLSEFLVYISEKYMSGEFQLPSLAEISKEIEISISSLREQLEVARVLGFVEIKPRTGIRLAPYKFLPSLLTSLTYAIHISPDYFKHFLDLRNHLETAYYLESTNLLTKTDLERLNQILIKAEQKIISNPPQLPHTEHREFHLMIFSKVQNPFVLAIFDAYWELYEMQGYAVINDLNYLSRVLTFHRKVYESLLNGNYQQSLNLFLEHKELLIKKNQPDLSQKFE